MVVAERSGKRVDRERPAVAPEATLPRPRERRRKGSREPMVRPTTVMLRAAAAAVLALEEPGVSTASTTAVFKRIATRAVMAVWVSAIPFQGVQFTTVVVVEVGATTTTCLQRIPMD